MRTRGKAEGAPFSSVAPQSAPSSPGLLADETLMSGITDYVALNLPVLPLTQVSRALGHNVYPRAGDWVEIKTLGTSPIVQGAVSGVTGTVGTRIYATDTPNTPDDGAAIVEVSPSSGGSGPSITLATSDPTAALDGANLTANIVSTADPFIELAALGGDATAELIANDNGTSTGVGPVARLAASASTLAKSARAFVQASSVLGVSTIELNDDVVTIQGGAGGVIVVDSTQASIGAGSTGITVTSGNVLIGNVGDKVAFYGVTPAAKPTVTGSRGGNAALASLLTALATLGLIVDSSSP